MVEISQVPTPSHHALRWIKQIWGFHLWKVTGMSSRVATICRPFSWSSAIGQWWPFYQRHVRWFAARDVGRLLDPIESFMDEEQRTQFLPSLLPLVVDFQSVPAVLDRFLARFAYHHRINSVAVFRDVLFVAYLCSQHSLVTEQVHSESPHSNHLWSSRLILYAKVSDIFMNAIEEITARSPEGLKWSFEDSWALVISDCLDMFGKEADKCEAVWHVYHNYNYTGIFQAYAILCWNMMKYGCIMLYNTYARNIM